mgnify:CR=1 FL=1
MNNVTLIGRLTKDPEIRQGNTAVANFTLAIDRPVRQGENRRFRKDGGKLRKIFSKGQIGRRTGENSNGFLQRPRRQNRLHN